MDGAAQSASRQSSADCSCSPSREGHRTSRVTPLKGALPHRITGDRRQGCSRGAGYEKVRVAIDDATRLAYVEVLADEQKATTVGFLARAVGWFSEQGITCRRILSDNGPAYRSGDWRKACRVLDLRPIRTKPYTPQTNGKAERFIKTLLAEWAYVIADQTSEERNGWLPRYLGI